MFGSPESRRKVTICSRAEKAVLHLLPTLWFRNTWSFEPDLPKPSLRRAGPSAVSLEHHQLKTFELYFDGEPELLFTENETNLARLYGMPNASPYVKDAFHDYVIHGRGDAVTDDNDVQREPFGVLDDLLRDAARQVLAERALREAPLHRGRGARGPLAPRRGH